MKFLIMCMIIPATLNIKHSLLFIIWALNFAPAMAWQVRQVHSALAPLLQQPLGNKQQHGHDLLEEREANTKIKKNDNKHIAIFP